MIALTVDGTNVAYAYNAQGIRTAKRVNNARTAFLLDGGNVVAEVQNNTVTDNYLRGVNLIRRGWQCLCVPANHNWEEKATWRFAFNLSG